MKKNLRFAFFTILSLTGLAASAQTTLTDKKYVTITLNANLAAAYNMKVDNATVNIDMNSVAFFQNGNASTPQILTVNATQGYEVRVKANTDNLIFGSENIPVNTINVIPSLLGTGTTPTDAPNFSQKALGSGENTIIQKTLGETERQYNIVYAISAANTNAYLNKPAGTYATTVTYSLYAK